MESDAVEAGVMILAALGVISGGKEHTYDNSSELAGPHWAPSSIGQAQMVERVTDDL